MQPEQSTKCSYLDSYKIIKTLGAGYHAQVQLGMDENGKLLAIKRYKKQTADLATLKHQLNIMKALHHENLVQLIDVRENATYKKEDESTFSCFAIILQYVGGGQLFDFIAQTGKFSEKVTRTYFHQMMNGLNYMHSKGYAHRDIKPQNILLTRGFVLKLADFGFSEVLRGKDGSGILHTKLGTEGYMAPQIPTKNYIGSKTDIFAAGVILFIMYAGNPPFEKAVPNDPYYKLIKEKNYSVFWQAHSRRRPTGYFSDDFKDLFVRMVAFAPEQRPSMIEISKHPWVSKDICTLTEITQQFELRFQKLNNILDERKQQQQYERNKRTGNGGIQPKSRDDPDLEIQPFMQLYENEQYTKRELGPLQPLNADDFLVDEAAPYAVALLKDFFKNKKIAIQDESEIIGEQLLSLAPGKVQDNSSQITCEYELKYEMQGVDFNEKSTIKVVLGVAKNQKLVIGLVNLSGNRLYYKKIAKQIKNLFAYCLV